MSKSTRVLWSGTLRKLRVEAESPVRYWLPDEAPGQDERGDELELNSLLEASLALRFTGEIHCVSCGRKVKKTMGQGFCYPCFKSKPEADMCLFKPELCHFHESENPCRDEEWGLQHCFAPHILYVSLTSGIKVGITRRPNIPTRWIDQGAVKAIPLAVMPNRREVGLVEHRLSSEGVNDKTHWMKMLKGDVPDIDVEARAAELVAVLESWDTQGILPLEQREVRDFTYPVREYPKKVKSLDFGKIPEREGRLMGMKGQYLLLDTGVVNIRKFAGYEIEVSVVES
jgi:hypothetical protein